MVEVVLNMCVTSETECLLLRVRVTVSLVHNVHYCLYTRSLRLALSLDAGHLWWGLG